MVARILVVSDLHYDERVFRGVDESRAWDWLLSIVRLQRPDLLVGLGDWGLAVNVERFYRLLRMVRVWAIYGNHDNLDVLRVLYNVRAEGYEPVLMGDGEVRAAGGLRFGAINGIVALKRRSRKGVPRRFPDEYLDLARKLAGRVDVLLTHDSPRIPVPEFERIVEDERNRVVLEAVRIVRPGIHMCGHMHLEKPYTVYRYEFGTLYIRVDSSQKSKAYAVLDTERKMVEIWVDTERKETINISDILAGR